MGLTTETPWNSLSPLKNEWEARNVWTKILLIFNITNPVGLGIDISGTTAEVWKTYMSSYETASDMTKQNAEQKLQNLTFSDRNDFQNHITIMRNKLTSEGSQNRHYRQKLQDHFIKLTFKFLGPSCCIPIQRYSNYKYGD